MEGKQLFGLFLVWFALSFLSNTSIKSALQFAQPPSVTFAQMLIGWLGSYAVLRFKGIPTQFSFTAYLPLAFLHYGGNLFTNYGIYYGSVSYTQVVKSLEPISTAVFAVYILKDQPPRTAILCMIPIITGVILVSSGEAEISSSLLFVFISNIFLSYRNVSIKDLINTSQIQDPTTLMYRMCFLGTLASLPALTLEANHLFTSLNSINLYSSGLFYFLYDSCSFLLLFYISVLSHSIGSVMKRIVVITLAIIFYHSKVYPTTIVGITLCVAGSFLYTYISKSKDEQRAKMSRVVYLAVFISLCSLTTHFFVINPHYRNIEYLPKNDSSIPPIITPITSPPPPTIQPSIPPTPQQESPTPQQAGQQEEQQYATFRPLQEYNENNFILFWTRAEYAFPARLEKSIESILFHHKKATINLYTTYIDDQVPLQKLQQLFPNQVIVKRIEVHDIFRGTPLQSWGRNHRTWKWKSFENFDYHLVDAMRYAVLWKYGGIAIDADMIVLKPIEWKSNVISTYLGQFSTKILKFEPRHSFIEACMTQFARNYDFKTKEGNGAELVERLFSECRTCSDIEVISILDTPTSFKVDDYYSFNLIAKQEHDSLLSEILNETNIAFDVQYWLTLHRIMSQGSVIEQLYTRNNYVRDPNILASLNRNSLMKFATWMYEYSTNVGDEVQSIAHIQYLPRIDYFIARDDPMRFSNLPNITIISNGWFSNNKKWNLPPNFHPIFVAFHGTTYFPYNNTVSLFKRYEPIGCRDLYTLRRFQQLGVQSYYSGCITTTMENIYDKPRNDRLYLVDTRFPFPSHIMGMFTNRTHSVRESQRKKYVDKYTKAASLLEDYATGTLVITHRIHCGLPSLGMGTPVLFVSSDDKKSFTSYDQLFTIEPRFTGLIELFTTIFQNTTTPAQIESYPYTNPPPNKPNDDMKQRIWAHLQRSPYIKESGRMFGMYK